VITYALTDLPDGAVAHRVTARAAETGAVKPCASTCRTRSACTADPASTRSTNPPS
jgi:hypothetical protein